MAASFLRKFISLFHVLTVILLCFFMSKTAGQQGSKTDPYVVPECQNPLQLSGFRFWHWHKGKPKHSTTVNICVVRKHGSPYAVNVTFDVDDSYIMSNFTKCHDPVYKNDSVEFFITPQSKKQETPNLYMQFDINPYSAMLPILLNNTCGVCNWTCISHQLKKCDNPGIIDYSTSVTSKKTHWRANMVIRLDFIHDHTISKADQDQDLYRANFYRIDLLKSGDIHYSGWRSTNTTKECFHVPKAFGYFKIANDGFAVRASIFGIAIVSMVMAHLIAS